jgi:hypothetical protein
MPSRGWLTMSELTTLHPYNAETVARYAAAVRGDTAPHALLPAAPDWIERELDRARRGYARGLTGNETGANAVSYGLARLLAASEPVFLTPGAGFTQFEARIDRGIGMLLRPPSRLFADAGLETAAARAMPIRLDASGGSMGGAFMPPHLVPQWRDLLEQRLDRLARRMTEAELDAPALLGLLLETARYAGGLGLGLYEATDVFVPGVSESEPPGMRVAVPDRKRLERGLRQRLEAASRPPKQPGLLARLLGRGTSAREEDRDGRHPWKVHDVTPPPDPEWREGRDEGGTA